MKRTTLLLFGMFSSLAALAQNSPSWPSSGNVGIGTTTPQGPLSIKGSVSTLLRLYPTADNGEASIGFNTHSSETDASNYWVMGPGAWSAGQTFVLGNTSHNGPVINFLTSGNVGIGLTDPQSLLHMKGTSTNGMFRLSPTADNGEASISFNTHTSETDNSNLWVIGSGSYNSASNLVIANTSFGAPLMTFLPNGSVGIGTASTYSYKLAVNGSMIATQVVVKNYSSWPDYVFKKKYALMPLSNLKQYIKFNNHLPGISPAIQIEKDGVNVSEMNELLLKKVEELTLYVIQKDDQLKLTNELLQKQNMQLKLQANQITNLQQQIKGINKKLNKK